jgi:predicted phage terminase large subunit-like protein
VTLDQEQLREYIRMGRHKARTDLMWLCHNVLGMTRVNEEVHGTFMRKLQQFDRHQGWDRWDETLGRFVYIPKYEDPIEMSAYRKKNLILAPRSWYKSSVNVMAHSIQWILNYPDITMLLMHASQETIEKQFAFIKQQFHKNAVMRFFFPEFCPPVEAKEFGTQTYFQCPARTRFTAAPTMNISGIESIRTGMHYHVIKFTDIVDEKNSATKDQCQKVAYSYDMAQNLLISPLYWIDVEGTRYNFSDVYGRIIDQWIECKKNEEECEFDVFVMGCYKTDLASIGKAVEEYTPDEQEAPFVLKSGRKIHSLEELKDPKYKGDLPISRFPSQFPAEALEKERKTSLSGEMMFATQKLNNPSATDDTAFNIKMVLWKDPEEIKRVPAAYHYTTVDTADTTNNRSDYTVITTAMVDRMNRKYVVDVRRGRFKPDEIISHIFQVYDKYKPLKVKVEETGFVRGLKDSIQRRSQMTGVFPPFVYRAASTQISKTSKILAALQPPFKDGLIFLSTGLADDVKEAFKHEFTRFPKYVHDDILDSLAALYTDEDVSGPVRPEPTMAQLLQKAQQVMWAKADRYQEIFGSFEGNDTGSWSGLG